MAAEQGAEGGAGLVLLLVKPLQVAGEEEGEGGAGEPYGGRQWTIRPHYPIMPASYAHY